MKKVGLILLVIFISLSCLLISLEQHSMEIGNYLDNYKEHNIEEVTGRSWEDLVRITEGLIQYVKGDAGNEVLRPHYNEKEILHMEDVQVLFKYGYILKYIALAISIALITLFVAEKEIDLVGRYLYKGLFVNWGIIGILFIMILFNFNKYFTYFHLIFFSNDLWLLDPKTDLLIQMLPEAFFIDMAIKIVLSFLAYVATIQLVGYVTARKGRKNNEEIEGENKNQKNEGNKTSSTNKKKRKRSRKK